MAENSTRPFYAEYAWAFDLLIDRPVRKEGMAIAAWLRERGVLPGFDLLDAGCGTGRYAAELARRGHVVHGIDASPGRARNWSLVSHGPGSVTLPISAHTTLRSTLEARTALSRWLNFRALRPSTRSTRRRLMRS